VTDTDADDPDRELLLAVARGEQAAFRSLVERHQGLVVGILAGMLGPADAEDIAQHVFLNVWRSAPRWKPRAKVITWIMTIARRLAFNELRRRRRSRIQRQQDGDCTLTAEGISDPSATPDRVAEREELHLAIEEAMACLSEKERMAVLLRRNDGMPYEEMAAVIGTSIPAVKSLLFRARQTLRLRLACFLDE
jgi:RNA polymerase sigma-70 factor (ECF subfamily)